LSVKADAKTASELLISAGKPPVARVVLLLEDLKFGGTQRQAIDLARELNTGRFQVEIWLMVSGDDLAPLAESSKVPVCWLSRKSFVGPESLMNLWRRLKAGQVDLLVLMTVIPNIWGRILGRLAGTPAIVGTCRGGGSPRRQHERWLSAWADHHLCNSLDLRDRLTREYGIPEHQITALPNGVDTDYFCPPGAAGPFCHPRPSPVVLAVARLVPDKDHDTLIRAFELVAARFPEVRLQMVGDGPRREALQRMIDRSPFADRISLSPGRMDLRPLLEESDIFVLSSHREGLPNVVLEAMASGLPVVATNVGGLPEVVKHGETGWLVPRGDISAMAAAIGGLLSDEASRVAFGRSGRKRAGEEYAISRMVQGHEEVFHRLLDRRS
jgi:glycosyltransferase involved in cell wall biosynthesis